MAFPVQSLTIISPDDWHVHLRYGDVLPYVLGHTAAQFARVVVMPNLKPPVTTTALALALPFGAVFEPLMTLYLTDNTPDSEIQAAHSAGVVV